MKPSSRAQVFLLLAAPALFPGTARTLQLTPEQIQGFRAARAVRFIVQLELTEAKTVRLPFEAVGQRLTGYASLARAAGKEAPGDLIVRITVTGEALAQFYSKSGGIDLGGANLYTGASLSGTIALETTGFSPYSEDFHGSIDPPSEVTVEVAHTGQPLWYRTPAEAPWLEAFNQPGSFAFTLLYMIGKIYGEEVFLAAAADEDAVVRTKAAEALGLGKDPRAAGRLVALLTDAQETVRVAAAQSLGALGDPQAVIPLISTLKDDEYAVRATVAESLGKLGDLQAVGPLIDALKDGKDGVRYAAAESLGLLKDIRAVEPLVERLNTCDEWECPIVARALGEIRDPRAVEALVRWLISNREDAVKEAAIALGKIGDSRAVEPLLRVCSWNTLGDKEEEEAARAACEALRQFKEPEALDILAAALAYSDDDQAARRADRAAAALGDLGDVRSVEPLIAALRAPWSWGIKESIAGALAKIGDRRAVEPLIAALKYEYVGRGAALALGDLHDPRAVKPLIAALKNSDIGFAAAVALGKIGDTSAVKPLIAALQTNDSDLRHSAAQALGKIGGPGVFEALIQALRESKTAWEQSFVLIGLGDLRDPRAITPIATLLLDPGPVAICYATEALGKIGDLSALDPLLAALRSDDPLLRRCAAEALGMLPDPRAIEPIIGALERAEAGERSTFAAILKRITGQDFGEDAAKWRAWWKEEQRKRSSTGPPQYLGIDARVDQPAHRGHDVRLVFPVRDLYPSPFC